MRNNKWIPEIIFKYIFLIDRKSNIWSLNLACNRLDVAEMSRLGAPQLRCNSPNAFLLAAQAPASLSRLRSKALAQQKWVV